MYSGCVRNYCIAAAILLTLAVCGCQAEDDGPVRAAEAQSTPGGKALYDTDDESIVKKSRGGICYDSSDGRFDGICHYVAYANMKDCLDDGGRRPK